MLWRKFHTNSCLLEFFSLALKLSPVIHSSYGSTPCVEINRLRLKTWQGLQSVRENRYSSSSILIKEVHNGVEGVDSQGGKVDLDKRAWDGQIPQSSNAWRNLDIEYLSQTSSKKARDCLSLLTIPLLFEHLIDHNRHWRVADCESLVLLNSSMLNH